MAECDVSDPLIESAFRNGSLTAISVLVGFSLSFLARWAGLSGPWEPSDIVTVVIISIGIILEIVAVALLLSVRSLLLARYKAATAIFLAGLGLVGAGVLIAIVQGIYGIPQQILKGG